MKIIAPDGNQRRVEYALSPPPRVDGLTIGVLENSKDNALHLLVRMRDELLSFTGAVEGPIAHKHYSTIPAEPEQIGKLAKEAGLVLVGSGD